MQLHLGETSQVVFSLGEEVRKIIVLDLTGIFHSSIFRDSLTHITVNLLVCISVIFFPALNNRFSVPSL